MQGIDLYHGYSAQTETAFARVTKCLSFYNSPPLPGTQPSFARAFLRESQKEKHRRVVSRLISTFKHPQQSRSTGRGTKFIGGQWCIQKLTKAWSLPNFFGHQIMKAHGPIRKLPLRDFSTK